MALMTDLINSEPSSFEEAAQHDVWKEAMVEEYDLVMKNQVWKVVLRLESKTVVGSRWIQGESCSRRKCGEVQGTLRGKGVFTEGRY